MLDVPESGELSDTLKSIETSVINFCDVHELVDSAGIEIFEKSNIQIKKNK